MAIDATQYERSQVMRQFSSGAIERELNKAYVGFLGTLDGARDGRVMRADGAPAVEADETDEAGGCIDEAGGGS